MGLIKYEGIARAIEMVGDVEVHDWISLSDRSKDFYGTKGYIYVLWVWYDW